jgi:hypothetical protein
MIPSGIDRAEQALRTDVGFLSPAGIPKSLCPSHLQEPTDLLPHVPAEPATMLVPACTAEQPQCMLGACWSTGSNSVTAADACAGGALQQHQPLCCQ